MIEVTIGRQGRLVVPAPLRHALGLEPGDVLVARAEQNRLILESRAAVLSRIRERFSVVPAGVSLVDDLLEERRAEVERDARR